MDCKCRTCGKVYPESKSTADWKGYCSMACQHAKATSLGYKKRPNFLGEYDVLRSAREIGNVPATNLTASQLAAYSQYLEECRSTGSVALNVNDWIKSTYGTRY